MERLHTHTDCTINEFDNSMSIYCCSSHLLAFNACDSVGHCLCTRNCKGICSKRSSSRGFVSGVLFLLDLCSEIFLSLLAIQIYMYS